MSFSIGPYQFNQPWILAPMAGVSEMPFRVIALECGAALAPTELISAKGITYNNIRTQRYLTHSPQESPFMVQLFGGEPDVMAEAAAYTVKCGAHIIDINMGCPVKKVTKTGAGSALLCDTSRASAVVRAMRQAVSVPITCKIRAGWDSDAINCEEVALVLEEAGASAIALHPRTRAQGYSGKADWNLIKRLRKVLTKATLIGNGDVTSYQDARRMLEETGCDAVMIGRAALGNPWIFRELTTSNTAPLPTPEERTQLILRHFTEHLQFVGDELRAIREMRQHLIWYSRGLNHAKLFREQILQLEDKQQVISLIQNFFGGALVVKRHTLDDDDINYQTALG